MTILVSHQAVPSHFTTKLRPRLKVNQYCNHRFTSGICIHMYFRKQHFWAFW